MLLALTPVIVLLYFLSPLFGAQDISTNLYILSSILLNLVCSFFIFGLFPIACAKWLRLVITEKDFMEKHGESLQTT